jgi:hypothetical protein
MRHLTPNISSTRTRVFTDVFRSCINKEDDETQCGPLRTTEPSCWTLVDHSADSYGRSLRRFHRCRSVTRCHGQTQPHRQPRVSIARRVTEPTSPLRALNRVHSLSEILAVNKVAALMQQVYTSFGLIAQIEVSGNHSHAFNLETRETLVGGNPTEPSFLHAHVIGRGDPQAAVIGTVPLRGPEPGQLFNMREGKTTWQDGEVVQVRTELQNQLCRAIREHGLQGGEAALEFSGGDEATRSLLTVAQPKQPFKVGDLVYESWELRQVEECNDKYVYGVCYPNRPSKQYGGSRWTSGGIGLRVFAVTEESTRLSKRFSLLEDQCRKRFGLGGFPGVNRMADVYQWLSNSWTMVLEKSLTIREFDRQYAALMAGWAYITPKQVLEYAVSASK